MQAEHESVLLHEVVGMLAPRDGDVVLDGTVNGGGHSEAISAVAKVTLIGLDMDSNALSRAKERLVGRKGKVILRQANFRDLDAVLKELGISSIDKALFDLGLSSTQLESSGRGFSFKRDEPLLMTFAADSEAAGITARDIVNEWGERDIANVLFGYGEERYARRIAGAIVDARAKETIETSGQLARLIETAVPASYRRRKTHPATKTFQALRIATNDELRNIREALPKAWELLSPGGRIAVISFHSLEDRIVKHTFREFTHNREGILCTKKPITPTPEELRKNPRARSAKLRVIEKIK